MEDWVKILLLILAAIVVLILWSNMSVSPSDETLGASRWQGEEDIVERVRALQASQKSTEGLPAPEYDAVFYPPPAVTEYITSIQFEHLENEEPKFDVAYQPVNQFTLVKPREYTLDAFKQATRDQIEFMKTLMHQMFDHLRVKVRMSNTTFNQAFTSAHDGNKRFIKNWRSSELELDLLTTYQQKLCDTIWLDFQAVFYKNGYNIDPAGRSARVDIANSFISGGHRTRLTETGFENSQNLTETSHNLDGIGTKPRDHGVQFDRIHPDEKARTAKKYVERIFDELTDHYKYVIRDMPPKEFGQRSGEIMETGMEILVHYLGTNDGYPGQVDLDGFVEQVEESMRETLFEILMENSVDITQFD